MSDRSDRARGRASDRLLLSRMMNVLLELDPERLGARVVIESRLPHLYGEIDVEAVKLASPYRPRPDGTFDPLA